ncbi:type VI secretion system lipoprotein TssJ [Marinobacterium stanieri]|uniref:type VI secretion system lipoprotein TssJ n=1 Tax=Marinobacterium stanieri TaxID=49186 RepID=UPI003A8EBD6D
MKLYCKWVVLIFVVLHLAGCASKNPIEAILNPLDGIEEVLVDKGKPIKLEMYIDANTDINPDDSGQASPLEVRVYQFENINDFQRKDFFSLYQGASKPEGLLDEQYLILLPGGNESISTDLNPRTRYIGVVAAYRDIDESSWRDSIQVRDSRGFLSRIISSQRAMRIDVVAERSAIEMVEGE